jgi:hypothetical protein
MRTTPSIAVGEAGRKGSNSSGTMRHACLLNGNNIDAVQQFSPFISFAPVRSAALVRAPGF